MFWIRQLCWQRSEVLSRFPATQASTIGSGPDESEALVLALLEGWTELKRMSFITCGGIIRQDINTRLENKWGRLNHAWGKEKNQGSPVT